MEKSSSIDFLKGVLILLVMSGHVMELSDGRGLSLWIGSGVRMPLMMGISGYLLNIDRTRHDAPGVLLSRYGRRLLLPWTFAVLIYAMAGQISLSWTAPIDLLLRPPFHLWYVPVLFFLIWVTRILAFPPLILLALGMPVSLAVMYGFGLGHGPLGDGLLAPDSRFLRYPVYFFFGMLLAERAMARRPWWSALVLAGLGIVWWASLYAAGNNLAYVPARLLMCLGLIALLPLMARQRLHVGPVNAMGRDSLFFYLWHPLVIGAVLMTGIGPLATLALSVVMLAVADRLLPRKGLLPLLLRGGGRPVAPDDAARSRAGQRPRDQSLPYLASNPAVSPAAR